MKKNVIVYVIQALILAWLLLCTYRAFGQTLIHVKHLSYDIIYNQDKLTPECVYYVLQADDFKGTIKSKPKYFKTDTKLPPPRRKNKDFKFSNYQRGHLCPSGDRDSRKDWFKDTYVTSNIVPMTPAVNGGVWKDIEEECRSLVLSGHKLKIVCGTFAGVCNTIGFHNRELFVPDSLYKIAKCIHCDTLQRAWIVPNDSYYHFHGNSITRVDDIWPKLNPTVSKFISLWINQ